MSALESSEVSVDMDEEGIREKINEKEVNNERLKTVIAKEKERNDRIKRGLEVLQRLEEEETALKRKREEMERECCRKKERPGPGQRNKVSSLHDGNKNYDYTYLYA